MALCIILSGFVVVVKKCQWVDNSSLSLFLRFSATFCPHAWSAASSPPVCLRVCLWCGQLLEVCWNSAAGTLPESRYSEPSLPASYYLLGFEHYLWLCMCIFGISYVSLRCQLVEVYLSENSGSPKICPILHKFCPMLWPMRNTPSIVIHCEFKSSQ